MSIIEPVFTQYGGGYPLQSFIQNDLKEIVGGGPYSKMVSIDNCVPIGLTNSFSTNDTEYLDIVSPLESVYSVIDDELYDKLVNNVLFKKKRSYSNKKLKCRRKNTTKKTVRQ
jgi:hypothetical protein